MYNDGFDYFNIVFDEETNQEVIKLKKLKQDILFRLFKFLRVRFCTGLETKEVRIEVNQIIELEENDYKDNIDFSYITFNKDVTFKRFQLGNKKADFKGYINLERSTFKGKVRLQQMNITQPINLQNTTFLDLVDFYFSTFESDQQFHLTNFMGISIFSSVTFLGQAQFLHCKVGDNSKISFQSAEFKQGLDIARANFWCKLTFWGISLQLPEKIETLYLHDDYLPDVPKYWKRYLSTKERKLRSDGYKKLKESCRAIKQNFKSENNNTHAVVFHKNEMLLFLKELESKLQVYKQNYLILILNKYSNNFGKSWLRGVLFTLGIAFIFYIWFLASIHQVLLRNLSNTTHWDFLKFYLQFINIINVHYEPFGIKSTQYSWQYTLLVLGRIFIGYGIYQTVQAFRKYANK